MINLKNLRSKKVGILGLGKTGLSVVRAVEQAGALLTCWDDDKEKRGNLEVEGVNVKDLNNKNLLRELDLLIVSPGIAHLSGLSSARVVMAASFALSATETL